MTVRVRFAPNPSGELHVGRARTTLFNWLFARHSGGAFIVRIEDTDPETAKPEFIDPILDALRWLGMDWDEGPDIGGPHGPYRQSERRDLHLEAIRALEEGGHVYRCYCTRDDIKARGTKTGYDRFCRTRSDQPEAPYALRFAVPEREVVIDDVVRGEVRTAASEMQDFVVARSDGSPTFVLANAADDHDMGITHAIRGTDLLSAAAQTALLFEALGYQAPVYAHVPLILGPDKAKLASRHGATSVRSFREQGFLADAMVNFLALLGWSDESGEELMTREQLVERFTLERVLSSAAVFDTKKLEWMNGEYVRKLPSAEFEALVLDLAPATPVEPLRAALEHELIQTRVTKLADVPGEIAYLHTRPAIDPSSAEKFLGTEEANRTLDEAASRLESLEPWTTDAIKDAIQRLVADLGLHKRKGPQPIRVAVSGSHVSLPLFESIAIIGRDETVARLRAARTG